MLLLVANPSELLVNCFQDICSILGANEVYLHLFCFLPLCTCIFLLITIEAPTALYVSFCRWIWMWQFCTNFIS